jgi:hypothetical protein
VGDVNLHDWIDELCDVLDVDVEVDEGLLLDLARVSAHQVEHKSAPITTFLLGYAAGTTGADPAELEQLAARATALANQWERPAGAPDPEEVAAEVEVPDDRGVDHSTDVFEDA